MNKIAKFSIVAMATCLSACQSIPNLGFNDNGEPKSAKAEAKPIEVIVEAKVDQDVVEMKNTEEKFDPVREAKVDPDAVSMITPITERQKNIRATGYAVISTQNHKNSAQQRLMAIRASKLDAYRALTEQVYGQQLDATTTVAEMMVTSDTFRTHVQGVIYGAVLESITPIGDDTYETTLSLDGRVVNDLRVLYLSQLAANR